MLKSKLIWYFFGDYEDRFMTRVPMLMCQRENQQCHIVGSRLQKQEFESSSSKKVSYLREGR